MDEDDGGLGITGGDREGKQRDESGKTDGRACHRGGFVGIHLCTA